MRLTLDNLNKIIEVFGRNSLATNNITVKDFYPIDDRNNTASAEKVAKF